MQTIQKDAYLSKVAFWISGLAGEQSIFTYWDPDMWEKSLKEFTVMHADLENKDSPAFAGSSLQPTGAAAQMQAGAGL